MSDRPAFPFTAIVGQDALREALLVCAVDPAIGGVLVRGERGTAKTTAVRGLAPVLDGPVVELPLGATADRVVGTLDLSRALDGGEVALLPGLLAAADGGVLYVDEVNLLADHLVDVLLDAAATGVVRVERDGLSAAYDARFALVGTMNPEEGDLRPQLLDRFGLSVDVRGVLDPGVRASVVRRRLAFDADPAGFAAGFADEEAALAARVADARSRLSAVRLPGPIVTLVAGTCARLEVDGHRADIVCARTAIALAALDGADEVDAGHVRRAAALALPHRRRRGPLEQPGLSDDELDAAMDDHDPEPPGGGGGSPGDGGEDTGRSGQAADAPADTPAPAGASAAHDPDPTSGDGDRTTDLAGTAPADGDEPSGTRETPGPPPTADGTGERPYRAHSPAAPHRVTAPDETSAPSLPLPPGRRRPSPAGAPVDATPGAADPSWPATLRAALARSASAATSPATTPGATTDPSRSPEPTTSPAAARGATTDPPRSPQPTTSPAAARGATAGPRLRLVEADLRSHVRAATSGRLVVFGVDASGSMGARRRMAAVKGAVLALLADAYARRDRVALVTFRGAGAELVLAPTASVERAAAALARIPTGGGTPVAAGIAEVERVVRAEARRDPARDSVAVLVTDGRASGGPAGRQAAADAATALARTAGAVVVVDGEEGLVRLGLAGQIAAAAGAPLHPLSVLVPSRRHAA